MGVRSLDIDVVATRGSVEESRHRVHAAVVDASGTLIALAGDAEWMTVWRSCAKPFQVLPFLESGEFDALDWDRRELALACASHGGEPEHIELAGEMLE
ncbi:MAG: asparaginase, partial [Gemmatimonadota bacterium]|nr:asparaginase [Gemmatimonadota bacterium]